ncbi:hypothetical protein SRIMM317S_05267 [Streptomyces rimosus subsp. rimosus]
MCRRAHAGCSSTGGARRRSRLVASIEKQITDEKGAPLPEPEGEITIHPRKSIGFTEIARTVFSRYRRRAILGLALFVGQAFLYNAVTFGFGAILTAFFDVPTATPRYYFAATAAGNSRARCSSASSSTRPAAAS